MNIAKLNTASLDDKTFIIKRGTSGGGTPDTPSGEYYLVKPNGWYWKFTDEFYALSHKDKVPLIGTLFLFYGTMYELIYKGSSSNLTSDIRLCYRDIGMLQYVAGNEIEDTLITSDWVACAEGGPTILDFLEVYEFESTFQAFNTLEGEMTEEEFEAMMLSGFKMQRITKEEYEALLTE